MALPCGEHQGGFARPIGGVGIGAGGEDELQAGPVSASSGERQGCIAIVVADPERGSCRDQPAQRLRLAAPGGIEHGGQAIALGGGLWAHQSAGPAWPARGGSHRGRPGRCLFAPTPSLLGDLKFEGGGLAAAVGGRLRQPGAGLGHVGGDPTARQIHLGEMQLGLGMAGFGGRFHPPERRRLVLFDAAAQTIEGGKFILCLRVAVPGLLGDEVGRTIERARPQGGFCRRGRGLLCHADIGREQ